MKMLITGVHGFVGSNLVGALKQEHTIYGLDIVSPFKEGVQRTYSWEELEALPQVDAIIHLAGMAHDTKKRTNAKVYFDVNTGLTKRVFDYFMHSSAQKFIFFSSVKAAADVVEGDVLEEGIVPKPKGPYGESKIKAEEYIKSVLNVDGDVWKIPSKSVYILRPCMIHGPGNKGNLNLLYAVVKKGIPWPLGAFDNRRTFTSIDNLCFMISELLAKDVPSGIYHMADDEALSTNQLIEIMCKAMGQKEHIWHLNKRFMAGCACLGDVLHLPLNTERLQKLTENYVVSNRKLKTALGIDKMPVSASDGLMKTIHSFENK